jgi:hypothetical protein
MFTLIQIYRVRIDQALAEKALTLREWRWLQEHQSLFSSAAWEIILTQFKKYFHPLALAKLKGGA